MAFHHHDGSVWVETLDHVHDGSLWTADDAELYVHDGSVWVLIQPDGATPPPPPDDFPPPFNLAVDSVTDSTVNVTWELPTSTPTPTEVQFRVLEISDIFDVLEYPATSGSHMALDAATDYTFQVRLVHRTDGVADVFSTLAEIAFTTTEAETPTGPFVDPDGTGGDSTFIPPVIGGTAFPGTPGPVDGTDCWWEWKVEIWSDGSWQATSPPTTGTYAGTVHVHPFDLATLPAGTYRYAIREVCNAVPGAWHYGAPFSPTTDWADPCADSPQGADQTNAIGGYTDAVFYIAQVCTPAVIHDAISNAELTKGAGYSGVFFDTTETGANWRVGALSVFLDDAPQKSVIEGNLDGVVGLIPGDFSVSFKINLADAPTAARTLLLSLGGNAIVFVAKPVGPSDYGLAVESYTTAGFLSLEALSPTGLIPGVDYKVTLRWDDDGPKQLFIDSNQEALNLAGDAYAHATISDQIVAYLPPGAFIWSMAGWDRLLTDAEIAETQGLLRSFVGYWDGRLYDSSGTWANFGTAGTAGDLILGTSTAAPAFAGSGDSAGFTFDGVNDTMATAGDVVNFRAPDRLNDFTVGLIIAPTNTTFNNLNAIMTKGQGSSAASSWGLLADLTALGVRFYVTDATHAAHVDTSGVMTNGVKAMVVCKITAAGNLVVEYSDGSGSGTLADNRTAASSGGQALSVGAFGGAFQRFKIFGAFIHRGALTSDQITAIAAYWGIA